MAGRLKVIQIRGTSGSGKTHTAREIMKRIGGFVALAGDPHWHKPLPPQMLSLGSPYGGVAIPGKYETACGGCDTIKTQDEIVAGVLYNRARFRHVIFEGLLISQIYERYAQLARDVGPDYWFCYLDTPLEKCIENVKQRRRQAHAEKVQRAQERGHTTVPALKELNESNTVAKHRDCLRNREKDLANGFNVLDLRHDGDPAGQILELLDNEQTRVDSVLERSVAG